LPEPAQQVGSGGVEEVVVLEAVDPVEELESRVGPLCEADRDGAVQLHHGRRCELGESTIEERDLLPVGRVFEVEGRDGRLQLVSARPAQREGPVESAAALLDLGRVPAAPVLVGEQHKLALRSDAGVAARVLQEEERVKAVRLRLVGHQRGEHGREADRLRAQLAPRRRPVAGVEDEVDGGVHRPESVGKKVLGRHAEWDACVADLPLRAHEPLRERRLRDEEAAGDLRRRQTADEAQRQRDLRLGGERRMAAREDQLQAFVGDDSLLVLGQLLGTREQLRLARERPLAPDLVDRPVARGRDDPRTGIRWRTVPRPALGRAEERVLYRILGEVEVAEDAAEDRDRAGSFVAVGTDELLYEDTSASRITTGRTSMWP